MKKIVLFIAISLFPGFLFSQADSIFAEVSGDTVTIYHQATERNCGSLFRMEADIEDFHLTITEVDTGEYAYCMCYFDLSVTIAGLSPGTYEVDIFGTDTLYGHYWGSTQFTIEAMQVTGQFNSDCIEELTSDELQLEVTDNYLTLNWNTPELNCGLEPLWHGQLHQDTFFVNMTDIGWPADCLCLFDLSVTFGPFQPGNYILDFWNGLYGYPQFYIPDFKTVPAIVDQYQSACYNITSLQHPKAVSRKFILHPNSPNPFNPATVISYEVFEANEVTLTIYNLQGQLVQVLMNRPHIPGFYRVTWNGTDKYGQDAPSGIYFVHLQSGKEMKQQKILLVR